MIITFYYNIDGLEDFIYEWASSDKEILIFFHLKTKTVKFYSKIFMLVSNYVKR